MFIDLVMMPFVVVVVVCLTSSCAAGLDGEATEDIVDELVDASNEQVDGEVAFRVAHRMASNGGVEQLLRILSTLRDFERERELATVLLRLIDACCQVRVGASVWPLSHPPLRLAACQSARVCACRRD